MISEYATELDKIMYLENEADLILHGHAFGFDDISLLPCFRKAIQEIIEGKEYDRPDNVIVYLPDRV